MVEQLNAAGLKDVSVSADGQSVALRANSAETNESDLDALARSAKCDTWLGKLNCLLDVNIDLVQPAAPAPIAVAEISSKLVASRTGDQVVLVGEVSSQGMRDRILSSAQNQFSLVVDKIDINQAIDGEIFNGDVSGALEMIELLPNGQVVWSDETLSVHGFSSSENKSTLQTMFSALGVETRGSFDVRTLDDPDTCNRSFAELLTDNQIQFRTSSSQIGSESASLLESIAQMTKSCPGNILIEGHTDNIGNADSNMQLSLARASSVRSFLGNIGVDVGRISTAGFGAERPIADNSTSEGRAANRRIVITVLTNETTEAQ